jgi:hypothetical protein
MEIAVENIYAVGLLFFYCTEIEMVSKPYSLRNRFIPSKPNEERGGILEAKVCRPALRHRLRRGEQAMNSA